MSTRSVLSVVGQVVGAYFGGPVGAAFGGVIGGAIGGAIDGPMRNTQNLLDDLNAIKFDYGSSWPRIYGRYRFKVSPMWTSTKRPVEHEESTGEKGGPSAVNTTFTYDQDWMCWAPLNATGFSRVWENGEIKYTTLAESDTASLNASANTTAWGEITFQDGNPSQLPWPVYEAFVGTDDAVAYLYRPMLCIGSLDLGGSGQPPLIEAEFYTNASVAPSAAEVRLQANFNDGDGTDISSFNQPYTLYGEGAFSDAIPTTEAGIFVNGGTDVLGKIRWTGDGVDKTDSPFTAQFRVLVLFDVPSLPGEQIEVFRYDYGTGAQYLLISVANSIFFGRIVVMRDFNTVGTYFAALPETGAHIGVEVVDNVTDGEVAKLYINGVLSITMPHSNLPTTSGLHSFVDIGEYPNHASNALPIRVDNVRIKLGLEETPGGYTGSAALPPPDVAGVRVTLNKVFLSDIVLSEALLLWTAEEGALTADDIDVTELEGIEVTGFATTGSPREAIAQLADMYYFGCVCSDKLYFRLRGGSSIGTIPFEHTGIGVGQPGTPFTGVERANDLEVAIQVAVTGPDQLSDYDPGTEQSDRLVGESVQLLQYTTPVVFLPSERKGRAETMVLDGRVASNTAKIALDDRHVEKEPFDVWIQVDDQGNSYRVRSNAETYADGVHDHDVALDDPTVLASSGITTEIDQRAITVAETPSTIVVPLDIPDLDGSDIERGLYVAAKPATTAGWGGYSFYESTDNVAYSKLASGTKTTVIGLCSVVPGNWTRGRVFNEVDSIVVDVGQGVLSSSTRAAMIADETINAFAIGAHGRWLLGQFRTATLTALGVYTLTGLITGSKGTEQHIGTQVVGDTFVLLKATGGVIRAPQRAIDQGALRYYKAVSVGKSVDNTVASTITQQEVGLMPLSPFRVRVLRDTSGNATITWQRRTRLATRTSGPAGILIPLGEESESYQVDICTDGTYAASAVTLSSSTESIAFSAADQTTYLGAPANPLYVQVRQRSAAVGLGFSALKAA